MVSYYQTGMSQAERATQAWNILIGCAANRQTITYGTLNALMEYGTNHLGGVLYFIKAYCELHDLPRLPYLVVNKQQGAPGGTEEGSLEELQAIFNTKWYMIIPPSISELESAREWHKTTRADQD